MPATLQHHADKKYVEIQLTGKLTKGDYQSFVPQLEQLIREHGKIRLLVEMRDFHGWDAGALWEDIKFDVQHYKDVERLAMVGEKRWQEMMATFCRPFTSAKIKYFESFELEDARGWITKERPESPTSRL